MAVPDEFTHEIEPLREELGGIDRQIIDHLARRFQVTEAIGDLKATHNIPAYQPVQHERVVERWGSVAIDLGWVKGAQTARVIGRTVADLSVDQQERLGAPKATRPSFGTVC